MRTKPILAAAGAAAILAAAGCGGGDDNSGGSGGGGTGGAKAPAGPAVTMKDISFKPGAVTVKKGQTVTWTNEDSVGHDVTEESGPGPKFKSGGPGGIAKGATFSHKFTQPGTYRYVCTVHGGMKGSIKVE